MEFKVVTLRYSASLGTIDDAPLVALAREHELLNVREHFFVVHDLPHLLCVVSYQRRVTNPAEPVGAPEPMQRPTPPAEVTPPSAPEHSTARPTASLTADQHRLYEAIRRWRYETAQRDGVPAYVVLTNRNVADLVRERPDSVAALRGIRGIGQAKAERHGEALLMLLRGESPSSGPTLVPTADAIADTRVRGAATADIDAPTEAIAEA